MFFFFFWCDIPKGDLRIQLGIELGALFRAPV